MSVPRRQEGAPAIDVVERVAAASEWPFDRLGDDELAAEIGAQGAAYQLWFGWDGEHQALHFSCVFPLRVPATKCGPFYRLLALVNGRLWLGHFDYWHEDGTAAFRHTLPLAGGARLRPEQVEELVSEARAACERFYPAFQVLIWAGRTPEEALAAALIETVGAA